MCHVLINNTCPIFIVKLRNLKCFYISVDTIMVNYGKLVGLTMYMKPIHSIAQFWLHNDITDPKDRIKFSIWLNQQCHCELHL